MQPAETGKNNASRWLTLVFVAMGVVTAAIGFWHWQPLPGDVRSLSPDTASKATPTDARSYLRVRPFDPLAYVALANELSTASPMSAEAGEKSQQALRVAVKLAPVDAVVMRGRIVDAYTRKDLRLAMALSADLAELSPGERGDAFAILSELMRAPEWPQFLASRLSKSWAVADAFVIHVCHSGAKPDVLLPLAIAVAQKQPLMPSTVNCAAAKAIADNQTPVAYWLWLNASSSLPKKIALVLNGDFESPLSGGPFDWTLGVGGDFREGFTVGLARDNAAPGTGNSHGNGYLMARFNGRAIRSSIAQQNLALKPGRYRLSYRSQMSGLSADKLTWTLRCGASVLALSKAALTDSSLDKSWMTYSAEFAVPATCLGQVLTLEVATRLDALQGLVGTAKYDDVIVRLI